MQVGDAEEEGWEVSTDGEAQSELERGSVESAKQVEEMGDRAATIVGPLNQGIRPFLKISLLEFHKNW